MSRIRLIHWNAVEARARANRLRAAGYVVVFEAFDGPPAMRKLKARLPVAVVIDLSRLPAQGRDVALAIRHQKTTRHLPIVFVEGDPEKVERIKKQVPDAVYTEWSRIRSSLKRAIAHPPEDPVVPKSPLDGYSGTPLPKKLGVKAGSLIALVGAPVGFERKLGELPEDVKVRRGCRGLSDLVIWFVKSRKDLECRLESVTAALAERGGLWIAWPKKASSVSSDLTQERVRKVGLAAGLVDHKICSIDTTWSALRFVRRRGK